jgi:hypothetical protein
MTKTKRRTRTAEPAIAEVCENIGRDNGPWHELHGDLLCRYYTPDEIARCKAAFDRGKAQYRKDADLNVRCGECGTPRRFTKADRADWVAAMVGGGILPMNHERLSLPAFKAIIARHFRGTRTHDGLGLCAACRRELGA